MTLDTKKAFAVLSSLEENIKQVIVGKDQQIRLAIACMLAQGHLLLEDVPGVGKTMLAKALAKSIHGEFKRIQFTPDLLPADITGLSVFNPKELIFEFRKGPVFANILLCDEINRATPRTQSSLLECMEEKQVTIDGITYTLPKPFFVMATQNPIEQQGTFPLPEAQLDRFLMCLSLGYPGPVEELKILDSQKETLHPIHKIKAVASLEDIRLLQEMVGKVFIHPDLRKYLVHLVRLTRNHPQIFLGGSPRSSLALMKASQAYALCLGKTFVTPQIIKDLALPVLGHRLILDPQTKIGGIQISKIVEDLLRSIPMPKIAPEKGT